MKKTNFLKGLALAAVALVSGFATSCSEEELSIKNNPVELPAASASVSISVVDLEAGKLIGGVTTQDATSAIGGTLTVECPANAGYTTAAPITVSIPSLQKGQSVNVPVTFYVVTLESALAELMNDAYFTMTSEDWANAKTTETALSPIYKSNNWVGNVVTNTDEEVVSAWAEWEYQYGYEFVSALEAEEETEEGSDVLASSRAAETTVLDLIKTVKPSKSSWYNTWDVESMQALTVDFDQIVKEGVISLKKYGEEKPMLQFNGKYYSWGCGWSYQTITHDAGHDTPSHDGHDGHGHGGNSNAGGGIGGDSEGE